MDLSHYASNYRKRRPEILSLTDGKCLRCGIEDKALAINVIGEYFFVHMQQAHVFMGDQEKLSETALMIPLCQSCHRRFDHPHTPEDRAFFGLVMQSFIETYAKRGLNYP